MNNYLLDFFYNALFFLVTISIFDTFCGSFHLPNKGSFMTFYELFCNASRKCHFYLNTSKGCRVILVKLSFCASVELPFHFVSVHLLVYDKMES